MTLYPLATVLLLGGGPIQDGLPAPLSTGQEVSLAENLTPDKPSMFIFIRPSSSLERDFAAKLTKMAGERMGVEQVHLKTGDEPVAKQHGIKETPFAILFDRRGRETGRSSSAMEIEELARKALDVPRINWAEDNDPRMAELAKHAGRPIPSGILRTMSLQPEYFKHIQALSMKAHFADGFLTRRHKEMIATYVSALNKCKY